MKISTAGGGGRVVRCTSSESELAGLDVFHAHALPVEKVAEPFCSVTLVDSLSPALHRKVIHVVSKLVHAVVDTLGTAVDDVDTVVRGVLDELLHVATEPGKIGCDGRNTHDGALCGGVALSNCQYVCFMNGHHD